MISLSQPPSPAVRDCLFAWELLRRIGFTADVIYAGVVPVPPSGQHASAAILKLGDERPAFVWTLRMTQHTEASFRAEWLEAVDVWNAAPPEIDVWDFQKSTVFGMHTEVVAALLLKGIRIPGRN